MRMKFSFSGNHFIRPGAKNLRYQLSYAVVDVESGIAEIYGWKQNTIRLIKRKKIPQYVLKQVLEWNNADPILKVL